MSPLILLYAAKRSIRGSSLGTGAWNPEMELRLPMNRLSKKQTLLISLTLFSMFFGAGNLIFPPFLGAQAGSSTWVAMAGFVVTAICFPILGVAAVAMAGGLDRLAGRVHPKFAAVFTLLIYLSIGPCLAIPRTAGTSFEMAVVPFLANQRDPIWARTAYSLLFFVVASILAFRPDKLKDRLGKILTPALLCMIGVIFVGSVVGFGFGGYSRPAFGTYKGQAFIGGFLDGYQTMDTIAALNFGIIISINIRSMGVKEEKSVVMETIKAGILAGVFLFFVYGALAHIGAAAGGENPGVMDNGAKALIFTVTKIYGRVGLCLLGLIFFIACLNTCVGLLSCCSEYFCGLIPKVGYRNWVILFAGISAFIANIGLNRILELSVPLLNAIYPVAIVLIVLSFLNMVVPVSVFGYRGCVLFTGVASVWAALDQSGFPVGVTRRVMDLLPFSQVGLGWIFPAVAGLLAGGIVTFMRKIRGKR